MHLIIILRGGLRRFPRCTGNVRFGLSGCTSAPSPLGLRFVGGGPSSNASPPGAGGFARNVCR